MNPEVVDCVRKNCVYLQQPTDSQAEIPVDHKITHLIQSLENVRTALRPADPNVQNTGLAPILYY